MSSTLVDLADVSPLDAPKLREALTQVRLEEIRDADSPAFHAAYDMLAACFFDRGELEDRDHLAAFVRQPRIVYDRTLEGTYHLIAAFDGDTLVGVRDCYVDLDLEQGLCVVALAHSYVDPAWRRRGLAAALRTCPLTLARRTLEHGFGRLLPTLVVAEMEPADPNDPATVVRLMAYGRSGFSVLDPRRVPYSQPEFRDLPEASHTGIPLLGVVRTLGVEGSPEGTVPEHVAAAFPRLFYVCHRMFLPGERVDPSEAHVRSRLEAGGTPVPLLPLPTSTASLGSLAPLVRGAVLPLYPPGLRGPDPQYAPPSEEYARLLANWA